MNPTLDLSEITQKIGRLFVGGIPGPELDANTIRLIKIYHLGGIILFSRKYRGSSFNLPACAKIYRR